MLGENGVYANLQSGLLGCGHVVRGQHKNWDRRKEITKNFCGLEAVHYRHGKIEDNEIRLQLLGLGNGVYAIFGF
jgi:hypothetical protein